MAIELKIPEIGESIQEVQIAYWLKREGDRVEPDEDVVELESEKASLELAAPAGGVLKEIVKAAGETAAVGETIAYIDDAGHDGSALPPAASRAAATKKPAKPSPAQPPPDTDRSATLPTKRSAPEPRGAAPEEGSQQQWPADHAAAHPPAPPRHAAERSQIETPPEPVPVTPSARRALHEHGLSAEEVPAAGKRLRREDVERLAEQRKTAAGERPSQAAGAAPVEGAENRERPVDQVPARQDLEQEEIVPLSPIRRRIAQRLVAAQNEAALLTTFNQADLSEVLRLRQQLGQRFQEDHGVKLGMMSFFVKATCGALARIRELNAEIRGPDIVYHRYQHIGIAIGSQRGLVVPVLRHADRLSFAQIEKQIDDFARRAEDGRLAPDELRGGTFTISNGGVYGSLLSTPIVNPPQSGILGLHAIEERPVARDGQVVIRPMMYLALTYDHRMVDGREAVTFLQHIKAAIEEPARLLLEV